MCVGISQLEGEGGFLNAEKMEPMVVEGCYNNLPVMDIFLESFIKYKDLF